MITVAKQVPTVLPLESGDRLTREEFERRYEAMPQLKKAELIEGVVYVPSPLRYEKHGKPHILLIAINMMLSLNSLKICRLNRKLNYA